MTAENIADFIGKYELEAKKIVMTDLCDRLISESVYGGFIMNCPDQRLCKYIIPYLAPIQMGEAELKEFPIATKEEMEALWRVDEDMVMQAELSLL